MRLLKTWHTDRIGPRRIEPCLDYESVAGRREIIMCNLERRLLIHSIAAKGKYGRAEVGGKALANRYPVFVDM